MGQPRSPGKWWQWPKPRQLAGEEGGMGYEEGGMGYEHWRKSGKLPGYLNWGSERLYVMALGPGRWWCHFLRFRT